MIFKGFKEAHGQTEVLNGHRNGKQQAKSFIVMAEHDRVIPLKNTQNLIEAFKKDMLEIAVIKDRGHIDISSDDTYYRIMQVFIGEG